MHNIPERSRAKDVYSLDGMTPEKLLPSTAPCTTWVWPPLAESMVLVRTANSVWRQDIVRRRSI